MRVLVMGAGAVGGYYGALLAQQGHEVAFVARGAHLEAMLKRGLEIRFGEEIALVKPVRAVESPTDAGPDFDLVLFTVKCYDTGPAAAALKPVLGTNTAVLTLQNGVESADHLSAAVGDEHVLAGSTYIFAEIAEPGIIAVIPPMRRIVFGELSNELTPRAEAVAGALKEAGVDVRISTNPRLAIWQKYVGLAGFSSATSACQVPIGAIVNTKEGMELLKALVSETVEVGLALGVAFPPDSVDRGWPRSPRCPPTVRALCNGTSSGSTVWS